MYCVCLSVCVFVTQCLNSNVTSGVGNAANGNLVDYCSQIHSGNKKNNILLDPD